MFVLAFTALNTCPAPIWPEVLGLLILAGVATQVYRYRRQEFRSGKLDLVIDARNQTLHLPQTCGRKRPLHLNIQDLAAIEIEMKVKPASDGDITTFIPTLAWTDEKSVIQSAGLIECGSQRNAEDFVEWLRQMIARASVI